MIVRAALGVLSLGVLLLIVVFAVGPQLSGLLVHDRPTMRMASWNIENFGQKKALDNASMDAIADILRDYDLVAIQEISNVDERVDEGCSRNADACPGKQCGLIQQALLSRVAAENYSVLMSDQVKDERYAFVFDRDVVFALSNGAVLEDEQSGHRCDLVQEEYGRMVREPFAARFSSGAWNFTVMTAHTSPDTNVDDLNGLAFFFDEVRASGDTVLLGDLNADCAYLSDDEARELRQHAWLVPQRFDTTLSKSHCTYDQIIVPSELQSRFTGQVGVDTRVTDVLSDHYVVWAEFYTD